MKLLANNYPTKEPKPGGTSKNFLSKHARKLRASLTTDAIVLADKRVIILEKLVTEPYKVSKGFLKIVIIENVF